MPLPAKLNGRPGAGTIADGKKKGGAEIGVSGKPMGTVIMVSIGGPALEIAGGALADSIITPMVSGVPE